MTEYVELLTADEDGNAVEGPKYPRDRGVIVWMSEQSDRQRLAYPHKFFKRGEHGEPLKDTLVAFLVPDFLCDGASPSNHALQLVAQRMGWDSGRDSTP